MIIKVLQLHYLLNLQTKELATAIKLLVQINQIMKYGILLKLAVYWGKKCTLFAEKRKPFVGMIRHRMLKSLFLSVHVQMKIGSVILGSIRVLKRKGVFLLILNIK